MRAGDAVVAAAFSGGGASAHSAYLDAVTIADHRIEGATRMAPERTVAAGILGGAGVFSVAAGSHQGAAAFSLHPLADYGGPVPTQLPAMDSVWFDRMACSESGSCGDFPCSSLPVNARGVSRPQSRACDIGAAEVQLISR